MGMVKRPVTFNYKAFKQAIEHDPLSMTHIAIRIGLSSQTLLNIMKGEHQPRPSTLEAIYARYPELEQQNPLEKTEKKATPKGQESFKVTSLAQLKDIVLRANVRLAESGLVVLTWGNASGIDRERGIIAIKPSGVTYAALHRDDIVLVSLETGEPLPGERLRPSSDTPTHVCLYQRFPALCGIVHTHSLHATAWAQACRAIPCYGTTHADTFHGPVPLCRELTADEIRERYEWNTGSVIADYFTNESRDPAHVPGVLVPHHGPFTWGATPMAAVEHAIILEEVAKLAAKTEALNPSVSPIPQELLEKHFLRKHGVGAYYGQGK